MRICIFGAGAVGGHLAARLSSLGGHEVSVLARGAHLEAIRANGLTLRHGSEDIRARVAASDRAEALGPQDMVFVTLKATALGEFAAAAAPLLAPHTPVVFAQNGIPWWYAQGLGATRPRPPDLSRLDPGGALARTIAPERVVGAIAYSANELVAPGVVLNRTAGNNMLIVGERDDAASERIASLREALEGAGMSSPRTEDIRQAVWNKLIINITSACITVLTGEALSRARQDASLQPLIDALRAEARAIATAHGVVPEAAPQRPAGGHGGGAVDHKSSILQDYELGRPMEIEAQLMAPLAFARSARVETPVLDALVPLVAHKAAAKGLYRPVF
jgi:2-dehydropantoate 2-reductase